MTVVIGAKCLDGIVLIADRKLTRKNSEPIYREKIFGEVHDSWFVVSLGTAAWV